MAKKTNKQILEEILQEIKELRAEQALQAQFTNPKLTYLYSRQVGYDRLFKNLSTTIN